MGTTVFNTMAYEKNTNNAITIAPPAGSEGTNESHSRYIYKKFLKIILFIYHLVYM